MKTSDSRKPNPARAALGMGQLCAPCLGALLAASGCWQWPLAEQEDWGGAVAPSANGTDTSADGAVAQLASAETATTEPDFVATLGSERAPLSGAGLALSGDVAFVAGTASAGLDGSDTSSDAVLVARASLDGAPLWTREIGTVEADTASAVARGGGLVVIAGSTAGELGGPQHGFGDAFAAAWSELGEPLWTRQLGSAAPDVARGVSIDASGAVLLTGDTRGVLDGAREGTDADAFVAKLGPDGEILYTRQLGSQPGYDDIAVGVATDRDGNVVIAGRTFGALQGDNLGSADAFVAHFSRDGALDWTAQLGGEDHDAAEAVDVDESGAVYIAGQTGAFLAGGPGVVIGGRPLLAKYSPAGALLWSVELPEAEMGSASALRIDANAEPWIAGHTTGSFAGPGQGADDAFVAHFSSDGVLLAASRPAVSESDRAAGLALDGERLLLLSRVTHSGDVPFETALLSGITP